MTTTGFFSMRFVSRQERHGHGDSQMGFWVIALAAFWFLLFAGRTFEHSHHPSTCVAKSIPTTAPSEKGAESLEVS